MRKQKKRRIRDLTVSQLKNRLNHLRKKWGSVKGKDRVTNEMKYIQYHLKKAGAN